MWDAETGEEIYRFDGLIAARGSDWSPSGELAAVGGNDGYIHVFDPRRGREVYKFVGPPLNPFMEPVEFSPDEERILALGGGNNVYIYDLSTAQLRIPIPSGTISNVAWSPDGEHITIGVGDITGTAKIWDSVSGEELFELTGEIIFSLGWSPSGDRIAIGSEEGNIKLFDAISGEELLTLANQVGPVFNTVWSPDGEQLATTICHYR